VRTLLRPLTESPARAAALTLLLAASAVVIVVLFWQPRGAAPAEDVPGTEDVDRSVLAPEGRESEGPGGFGVGVESSRHDAGALPGPLLLTVPKLSHVRNAPVPTAAGDDEEALKAHAAIHLKGTGYPWEKNSNVYIAGHRMGYPNTPSYRAFYDLQSLENGDEIILDEPGGTSYVYRVYETLEVGPRDVSVTLPVRGKSIVSLQTCTLPDYTRRLVVRAEKVEA
jgi:sortase A